MTALKYYDPGTATWKTIGTVQGPQGPPGPVGPIGTVYDTDQIGAVKAYAGAVIPTNWMLADGRSLLRGSYPQLFTALGGVASPFGLPDGTHFNLPDLTHRFIYGAQTGEALNGKGGEATHLLTAAESGLPDHTHAVRIGGAAVGATFASSTQASASVTDGVSGGAKPAAAAHENMPPYVLLAQIIKVTGVSVDAGGALVGAAGPQGPQGPQGAQGVPGSVGTFLDVRRQLSAGNQYVTHVSGAQIYIDAAKTVALTLGYTPPVNAWWEVHAHMGILQKVDAAYHYTQPSLNLTPNDADGFAGAGATRTQHAQVQLYEPYDLTTLYRLTAGVAYTVNVVMGMSGGTWQYFQSNNNLFIEAKAWAR